jgi:hypothetical protein
MIIVAEYILGSPHKKTLVTGSTEGKVGAVA